EFARFAPSASRPGRAGLTRSPYPRPPHTPFDHRASQSYLTLHTNRARTASGYQESACHTDLFNGSVGVIGPNTRPPATTGAASCPGPFIQLLCLARHPQWFADEARKEAFGMQPLNF